MQTLVYLKDRFNRPDTLLPFLQNNVGQSPLLRIDCVTPYKGTPDELISEVCEYLSGIDPNIEVTYCAPCTTSTMVGNNGQIVDFLEIQIRVTQK